MGNRFRPLPMEVAEALVGPGKRAQVFSAHVSREMSQRGAMLPVLVSSRLAFRMKRAATISGTTASTLTRAALRATIDQIEKGAREAYLEAKPIAPKIVVAKPIRKYWVGPMTFKVKGHWRRLPNRKNGTHTKTA